jgi:uncharacterized damage-inducible protein DinB
MSQAMIEELRQESATTRRVLERVPPDKLTWKPHPKSMTLGQLAIHVATIPGAICGLAALDGFDASTVDFTPPQPASRDEVLTAFDASLKNAEAYLSELTPDAAMKPWRMTAGARELMTLPRAALLRTVLLNHWYHHRGQLSVYLRMLDVPIPVIYGRSADENPFA